MLHRYKLFPEFNQDLVTPPFLGVLRSSLLDPFGVVDCLLVSDLVLLPGLLSLVPESVLVGVLASLVLESLLPDCLVPESDFVGEIEDNFVLESDLDGVDDLESLLLCVVPDCLLPDVVVDFFLGFAFFGFFWWRCWFLHHICLTTFLILLYIHCI